MSQTYYQQQVFNKISVKAVSDWLSHEPQKIGDLIYFMLHIVQERRPLEGMRYYSEQHVRGGDRKDIESKMLIYIFKHMGGILDLLESKGI